MDTIILITLGLLVGLLASKSQYNKASDLAMGSLGALASNAVIITMGLLYNTFSFILILLGSVFVIHIGRLLKN